VHQLDNTVFDITDARCIHEFRRFIFNLRDTISEIGLNLANSWDLANKLVSEVLPA